MLLNFSTWATERYLLWPSAKTLFVIAGMVHYIMLTHSFDKLVADICRLQLKKLEEIYPNDRLGTSDAALAALLDQWSMETVFPAGSMCLPLDKGLGKDKAFVKDRSQFSGRSWDTEAVMKNRAEGLSRARGAFSFAEKTLLGHGGNWILNGDKPTLADLNAVWVFDWLITMKPSALDNSNISKETFPKVFAWCDRFREAHGKLKATKRVKGDEAKELVVNGKSILPDIGIDPKDPLGLKAGDEVSITPVDSGRGNPTVGKVTGNYSPILAVVEILT